MSERDWADRKCWDCRFAKTYGESQGQELKHCRRFPPVRMPREPGGEPRSAYPDVTTKQACAEFRK